MAWLCFNLGLRSTFGLTFRLGFGLDGSCLYLDVSVRLVDDHLFAIN